MPQRSPQPMPVRREPTPEQENWASDPRVWFGIYDDTQSGMLTHDQLLRALVRSNPRLNLNGARDTIAALGLATHAEAAGESITLERFLEIHETLLLTTAQQEDNALDTVMAMLTALQGDGHGVSREVAATVLWEENGIISRSVNRLSEL